MRPMPGRPGRVTFDFIRSRVAHEPLGEDVLVCLHRPVHLFDYDYRGRVFLSEPMTEICAAAGVDAAGLGVTRDVVLRLLDLYAAAAWGCPGPELSTEVPLCGSPP